MCVIYAERWMGRRYQWMMNLTLKARFYLPVRKERLRHIQNVLAPFFTSKYLHRYSRKEVVKMLVFGDMVHTEIKPPGSKTNRTQSESEVYKRSLKGRFKIHKSDDDEMLAFGWANVAITENGEQISDLQEDIVDPEVLEQAAYQFVELYREGGEMHERGGCAVLVESIMFTKEKMAVMGIPEGTLPEGWWIGFRVTDPDVWDKVKSGEYPMFSIEGEAVREEVEETEE